MYLNLTQSYFAYSYKIILLFSVQRTHLSFDIYISHGYTSWILKHIEKFWITKIKYTKFYFT